MWYTSENLNRCFAWPLIIRDGHYLKINCNLFEGSLVSSASFHHPISTYSPIEVTIPH